jgi:hypothetical protein
MFLLLAQIPHYANRKRDREHCQYDVEELSFGAVLGLGISYDGVHFFQSDRLTLPDTM